MVLTAFVLTIWQTVIIIIYIKVNRLLNNQPINNTVSTARSCSTRLIEMSATGGASQGRCLPGLRVVRKRYRGPGTQRAQEGTWVGFSQ